VFATKKDKDYNAMAEIICPMARKVYVTEYTNGPEPLPAAWLVNSVKKHAHDFDVVPDAEEALARAVKNGFTVVAGSLYLVGQLRGRLA
jgi:folylpolyglutamate synthase/dihydropteroate synthase